MPLTAAYTSWKLNAAWARAVALEDHGQLLVYSGLDSALRSLNKVVSIDPATGKETPAGKIPHIVHDAAGARAGDVAVLIGGGEQDTGSNEVVAITGPRAGQIIGHLPEPRSDVTGASVQGTAYVVGGYDGKTYTPAVLASSDGLTFSPVANLTPAVRYAAVVVKDTKIYIFGGKLPTGQTDDIQELDTQNHELRVVGHLPTPLGHAFGFLLNGSIYVAGGRTGMGDTTATTPASTAIWRFDPVTDQVTPAGTLPGGVADGGVAVVADKAYLVGGENNAGTPLNTVIVLAVPH